MCKRKHRAWFSIAVVGAWWPGRAGGGEEMGGIQWRKTLYAKGSSTGFANNDYRITMFISLMQKEKIRVSIHLKNILKN